MTRITFVGVALAAGLVFGCGGPDDSVGRTGLSLTVDILADTDVAGFRFVIDRVACDTEVFEPLHEEFEADLEDLFLPGMVPPFENNPLDENSRHLFADYFTVLPAGCYDVAAIPVDADGNRSEDCRRSIYKGAKVEDGKTTEIFLISQCRGDETGSLDVIASLNHPPELVDFEYSPSKFGFECEQHVLCVTATDPDRDPLEFDWTKLAGPGLFDNITVISTESHPNGEVTQCVGLTPRFTGAYEFRVTVYDLLWDDGSLVRFDDLGNGPSRDDLTFPLYTNFDIQFDCYDPETDSYSRLPGARDVVRAPGCSFTHAHQYYCNAGYVGDDLSYYCPNGTFDPSTVFPLCE